MSIWHRSAPCIGLGQPRGQPVEVEDRHHVGASGGHIGPLAVGAGHDARGIGEVGIRSSNGI